MMQREDGPIPEEYALWKSTDEEGVQWYVRNELVCLLSLMQLKATIMSSHKHILGFLSIDQELPGILNTFIGMVEPNETGGGILADKMGMGKTLSILALVLRMLGAAHEWAIQVEAVDDGTSEMRRDRHRSGATLIVASSDCTYITTSFQVQTSESGGTVMINE
jgi:SNF2 family DNA or RNA helicase